MSDTICNHCHRPQSVCDAEADAIQEYNHSGGGYEPLPVPRVAAIKGSEVFLVCCGGAPLHAFAREGDARDFIVSKAEGFALLQGTPSIVRMEVK